VKKMLTKFVQKFLLKTDPRFRRGDLVYRGDSNYEYEFEGIYYDYNLNAYCFMRDPSSGTVFSAPLIECRTPYTR